MQSFQYELKTKVYFGVDSTQQAMEQELSFVGKNVLLAYGGGSIKANGIYDEVVNMLRKAQKIL